MEKVSASILSGGFSTRMGMPKAYLKIDQMNFVEHLAIQLSRADEILFSVRKKEDYPDIPLRHIEDIFPGCGPLAGIHSSLKASRNTLLFVTACDIPFVTWETVETLFSYYKEDVDVVLPVDSDGRHHMTCGLYHKKLIPVMEELLVSGCRRLSHILDVTHHVDVPVKVFPGQEQVFTNINTMEEYRRAVK